jgi:lipid-binding SYLF domain-containing protein
MRISPSFSEHSSVAAPGPSPTDRTRPSGGILRYFLTTLLLICVANATSNPAEPAEGTASRSKEAKRLERAAAVLREIMAAPDQGLPQDLLDRTHCVVVIPSMKKAGFVFGGRYGKGVACCRKSDGSEPWGPPSMVTLGGGSFGAQIGGAAVDVLMLIMNPAGLEGLLKDKFTLGGDLSAAAGPVGRAATAETDALMNAKILTYSRSRGVFAGAELKGAVLMQDREGNRNLYGREVEAQQLLMEGNVEVPPAARRFVNQLASFSPKRSKRPL